MKKVLMVLLAFSLVFGLALTACGNSSGIADLAAEVEAMRKFTPNPPPPPDYETDGILITTIADWGGLDIVATKLMVGDVIKIEGRAVTAQQFFLNLDHTGWGPLAATDGDNNWMLSAGDTFDLEFKLTAATLGAALTADPTCIRIRTNAADATVYIWALTIERDDDTLFDLAEFIEDIPKGPLANDDIEDSTDYFQAVGSATDTAYEIVGP